MPRLSVMLVHETRPGNLRTVPLLPPSFHSSIFMLASSPWHSEKPPTTTSSSVETRAEPMVASTLLVSSRLTTKLWLSTGSLRNAGATAISASLQCRLGDFEPVCVATDTHHHELERDRWGNADLHQQLAPVTRGDGIVGAVAAHIEG